MNYAPSLPLKRDNVSGYEMITNIRRLAKFHLKNLLLTNPSEKISDPSYGVGLRAYLFEPAMGSTYSIIEDNISTQIRAYLPYIYVKNLVVSGDPDRYSLYIKIEYSLVDTNIADTLQLQVEGYNNSGTDTVTF